MQLELTWRDPDALRTELERRTGVPIALTITDNASTMLSVKPGARRTLQVRLHHMFLAADPSVVSALADWVRQPRAAAPARTIDQFIADNQHRIRRRPRTAAAPQPQGRRVDLQQVYDEVNAAEFDGAVTAPITWGKHSGRRRRQQSIRLGSYHHEDHMIRIHPVLDQEFVPDFVVRFIVFHEMLHAYLGIATDSAGRRRAHTAEFRRRERAYADFARADAWLAAPANLAHLLNPAAARPAAPRR